MRRPMVIIISASAIGVLLFVVYLILMQGVFARVASITNSPTSSVSPEQFATQKVSETPATDSPEPTVEQPVATPPQATAPTVEAERPAQVISPRQAKMIAAGYTADDAVIAESLIFDTNGMWRMDATGPLLAIQSAPTPDDRFSVAAQYVRDRYGSWSGAQAQALASNGRW